VAGFERHYERQPGLGQLAAEPVLVPVSAVGGRRPEHETRSPGRHRQFRADRQLGPERRIALALGIMPGRGVRHRVHRVIQPFISPHRGHGDHPVVGLAVPAQPLMADVGGLRAVLAVPAVVDHQHPAAVRRGRRIGQQQLQPTGIHLVSVPPRFGQEELQPLHRPVLRPHDRLGPGQRGQRLVPVPRRQQPGQVLPEPPPLRQRTEHVIKPRRIPLQRARRRRTGPTSSHRTPQSTLRHYSPAYREHAPRSLPRPSRSEPAAAAAGALSTMPATSAATRSRGKPGADGAQRPRPRRRWRRPGGVRAPSLRGRAPAAMLHHRAAAGDQRTRRPSRS
jgi:hypothetical protein